MPKSHHFKATSYEVMTNFFEEEKPAKLLYTFMAQTLKKDTPSFCLNLFGLDNTFTYIDVLKRWKFISRQTEKYGII